MIPVASDHATRLQRFVGRCEALVRHADRLGYDSAAFGEIRLLVEEGQAGDLPVPQFLFRTTVASVFLAWLRRSPPDVREEFTPLVFDFATGRTHAHAVRAECLALVERCSQVFGGGTAAPSAPETLKRVLGLIDTRSCDATLTLRDVSLQLNLSVSHVSRLVNQHLACGFRAHLNELRVAHAERLLRNPTLSIKQVAAAVGYRSTSELDRHFRGRRGTTPVLFRRSALLSVRAGALAAAMPGWRSVNARRTAPTERRLLP